MARCLLLGAAETGQLVKQMPSATEMCDAAPPSLEQQSVLITFITLLVCRRKTQSFFLTIA